jgi:thiamine-phosphate pyrophosphorylase
LTTAPASGANDAGCRPYLAVTATVALPTLERALDLLRPACVLAFGQGAEDAAIRAVRDVVQRLDAPLLLADDWSRARATGCDGVHLADPQSYGLARRELGAAAIIGVATGSERHAAIEAAEADADYVLAGTWSGADGVAAFVKEVDWWSSVTTVPCVAAAGPSEASWRALVEAGADFLAAAPELWLPPAEIAAAAARLARFLAGFRASPGAVASP